MHPNCVNGCISNLHIKFLFSLLRLAGAFFNDKRKAHLSQCESVVLQIASISSRRICFCLSVRVLLFEKSFCFSSVNRDSSPSAQNCASVMPNSLHTASKFCSVGVLSLLIIIATVEWERFASFASR